VTKLAEIARLIRSKNAVQFVLTNDVMFDADATYPRVKASGAVSAQTVATICRLPVSCVRFFFIDNALATKASRFRGL